MNFDYKNLITIIGIIILGIIAIMGASVIIDQGSELITKFFAHIQRLTQVGDIRSSVELILIAIFVGWTINRFKNKK